MSRPIKVIPSIALVHEKSGRRVSPYGSAPWTASAPKEEWKLVHAGWTWECLDGTIGLGRQPSETYEGAVAVMERVWAQCGKPASHQIPAPDRTPFTERRL